VPGSCHQTTSGYRICSAEGWLRRSQRRCVTRNLCPSRCRPHGPQHLIASTVSLLLHDDDTCRHTIARSDDDDNGDNGDNGDNSDDRADDTKTRTATNSSFSSSLVCAMTPKCPVSVQDDFGPIVRGCGLNFDFTLLFEESILFILPLLAASILAILEVVRRYNHQTLFRGGVLLSLKLVSLRPGCSSALS